MRVSLLESNRLYADLLAASLEQSGHTVLYVFDSPERLSERGNPDLWIIHLSRSLERSETLSNAMATLQAPKLGICRASAHAVIRDSYGDAFRFLVPDTQSLTLLLSTMTVFEHGYDISFAPHIESAPVIPNYEQPQETVRTPAPDRPLSEREVAVLTKIREGFSNKEIARRLKISDSTVKVHLRSIYRKANVRNRTQAAIWAEEYLRVAEQR